jgi:cobalt-zinc-cadmium resistance protein CzcA
VTIEVDRAAIARYGIPVSEVLGGVEAMGAREVGTLQEGEATFPIALWIDERYRSDPAALQSMLVAASNGDRVPLGRLAHVSTVEGPSTINREWGARRIVVQTNVRDRDVGSFVSEARRAIAERVDLPPGYYIRWGGQFEHLERASKRLMIVVPLALALIFTLLFLTFRNAGDVFRVFTAVPLAAVGGIIALWIRGMPFTISAGVGFIALFGVAVLNGIVLTAAVRQLMTAGHSPLDAIEEAAQTRLRPVLMTACVASLGFLPMALNTGFGAEVQRPLATVLIGGVISSTFLTLMVLPALFAIRHRRTSA